jgi:hypothetical protein
MSTKTNIIKFEKPKVITVVEPVKVSREVVKMMMDYQDEETDIMTAHLQPRPHLKVVK